MAKIDIERGVARASTGNEVPVDVSSLQGLGVRKVESRPGGEYWIDRDESQDAGITYEEIVSRAESIAEEAERKAGVVPQVVSAFQAEQALADLGYLDQVESLMKGQGVKQKSLRAWRRANTFRRDSPTIQELATQLGLTTQQVDDLFRHASTIEA